MSGKERIIEVNHLPMDIERDGVYSINQPNPNSYTHGMFKYPCKFIPEIPRWAIRKYLKDKKAVIFDPFAGSGTTLLEANVNGYCAWGTEIDDIAKLIIQVKTTRLSEEQYEMLDKEFENLASNIDNTSLPSYRPLIQNLEHWFSEEAIGRLGRLKYLAEGIEDGEVKDFLKLCFVSIIKRVSKADDTSPKPYVSNKIIKNPPDVLKEFTAVFKRYRQMMRELMDAEQAGTTTIIEGDALDFQMDKGIDLSVTSPPYINAFDYGRTMRLENLWLATLTEEQLRDKKKLYVGTEKIILKDEREDMEILNRSGLLKKYYDSIAKADEKRALVVKKFFEDMETNLKLVFDQLNPKGKYMIVIGSSTIRNVHVESWRVFEELGQNIGFQTIDSYSYIIQNPYIRIPRNGVGGKVSKDYVLVMEKGR